MNFQFIRTSHKESGNIWLKPSDIARYLIFSGFFFTTLFLGSFGIVKNRF